MIIQYWISFRMNHIPHEVYLILTFATSSHHAFQKYLALLLCSLKYYYQQSCNKAGLGQSILMRVPYLSCHPKGVFLKHLHLRCPLWCNHKAVLLLCQTLTFVLVSFTHLTLFLKRLVLVSFAYTTSKINMNTFKIM